MAEIEKIIVLAKAIPAVSPIHGEITCVAGINIIDGQWRRLHPVPTNLLGQSYFKKFDLIKVEVDVWKGRHPRPEDRWLIKYLGREDRIGDWEQRRNFLNKHLDPSVKSTVSSGRSLGIVKPTILDFYKDSDERLRYIFQDSIGKRHDMVCREWECMALTSKYPTDFRKVQEKFLDWIKNRDTFFVIGTTAPPTLTKMVVAVHYPPKLKK